VALGRGAARDAGKTIPACADGAAAAGSVSDVDDLLADLFQARIGATFNQYSEAGPDDCPGAGEARIANLRAYLNERSEADVVALGEAAG
jgi:hypothetical protein